MGASGLWGEPLPIMKLKELLGAIGSELAHAGRSGSGARLSLAFVARKHRNGEVECEFVDASDVSKPRDGEIHRLELNLDAAEELHNDPPDSAELEKAKIPPKRRLGGGLFAKGEGGEMDSPAIYRMRSSAV